MLSKTEADWQPNIDGEDLLLSCQSVDLATEL